MRTALLLKGMTVLPKAGGSHKLSHFITVSLVELMEKKMVFGAVCLHTSLAVIITDNKAVGSRRKERRDKRRWQEELMRREVKRRKMSCQCLCNKAALYVIVSWWVLWYLAPGVLWNSNLCLWTVPLMWPATKWCPVISVHLLAVVLYNQTLTRRHTNVNTRTPTQPQHTQTIHVPN